MSSEHHKCDTGGLYASIQRHNMMHADHAMLIRGRNKHLCLIRWLTLDNQNRCSGGEPLLNLGFDLVFITLNTNYQLGDFNFDFN